MAVKRPPEMAMLAAVAGGGIVGAAARWAVGTQLTDRAPVDFPWHTLAVNIVGCLLIGIVSRTIERDTIAWGFVATGVLGGFTTMSAFALELNDFVDADRPQMATAYLAATLASGFAAIFVGEHFGRERVGAEP